MATASATTPGGTPLPPRTPVVVLGATGCLGHGVCTAFEARGARITRVSRSVAPAPGSCAAGATDGGAFRLDLSSASASTIADLLLAFRPAVVVNAAGAVWQADEDQMRTGNAEATRRLVAALTLLPYRPRLIQLGSVHEYGPVPGRTPITEDLPPAPVSAYGWSKLLATEAVLTAARRGDVDATVLRVSNVTGPRSPGASLLGRIARRLADAAAARAAGLPPEELRLAPMTVWRDFVDIRDVAEAVVAAAASATTTPGEVLNIGRGEAVLVRGLVGRLIALSGVDLPVVDEPVPARSAPSAGPAAADRRGTGASWECLDISRARTRLHWQPRLDLDRSLRDLLADCLTGGQAAAPSPVG